MLLQPTSPLCAPEDIAAACKMAQERGLDAVVSVRPVQDHPAWMRSVAKNGRTSAYLPNVRELPRRQTLLPLHITNGAIFVVKTEILLDQRTYEPEDTYAYVMSSTRSFEIDTEWDLHVAELVLNDRLQRAKV